VSRRRQAFTIVEILISLLIFGILAIFIYKTFLSDVKVFQSHDEEAKLNLRAKLAMEFLKNEINRGGVDPCLKDYYLSTNPLQAGFPYFAIHPWGTPAVLTNATPFSPFQMFVVHTDTIENPCVPTTPGDPYDCTGPSHCFGGGSIIDIIPVPATGPINHYRPTGANVFFVNQPLIYNPATPTAPPGPPYPFPNCGGNQGDLLKVPIIYPADTSGSISLDCPNAQLITPNVECLYIDYFSRPNVTAGATTCLSGIMVPPGEACQLLPNEFSIPNDVNGIRSVRITLVLKSQTAEQGYSSPTLTTPCHTDPPPNGFPSGTNLTGVENHSVMLQATVPLENLP
jgi:prepilin-type N-terminal cleavage/methylation domain-containing protein